MKPQRWRVTRTDRLCETRLFSLTRRRSAHPRLGEADFFVFEAPAWVNIIPLTADDRVIMVRQFRHGIDGYTLEVPGGMVDPSDRSPRQAARREMVEETGYDSRRIMQLGRVHPNPAIQDNYCYSFLAEQAERVGEPNLDATEETEVVEVALADVPRLIATGRITHSLVISAFALMELRNGRPPRGRNPRPRQPRSGARP